MELRTHRTVRSDTLQCATAHQLTPCPVTLTRRVYQTTALPFSTQQGLILLCTLAPEVHSTPLLHFREQIVFRHPMPS